MAAKKGSLATVVASGDRLKALEALRSLLAERLDAAAPAYVAPIARQLQAVMAEVSELAAPKKESKVDDLAKRRAARRAKAAASG